MRYLTHVRVCHSLDPPSSNTLRACNSVSALADDDEPFARSVPMTHCVRCASIALGDCDPIASDLHAVPQLWLVCSRSLLLTERSKFIHSFIHSFVRSFMLTFRPHYVCPFTARCLLS